MEIKNSFNFIYNTFVFFFQSKVLFFDLQPFGRILNRFSSDTYTADDTLPFIANILCAQSFGLFGTIAVTTFTLPWTILIVIALAPFYVSIQNQYRLENSLKWSNIEIFKHANVLMYAKLISFLD